MKTISTRFDKTLAELALAVQNTDFPFNPEYEVIREFKSDYNVEIGYNNSDKEQFSIYMNFSPHNEDDKQDFLAAFWEHNHKFIPLLITMTKQIFSELTSDDACSFQINLDTDHLNTSGDEINYFIQITVTDYLS